MLYQGCRHRPRLGTWCQRASDASGARQIGLAAREAWGLDAGLPHAALVRELGRFGARSPPRAQAVELCGRVAEALDEAPLDVVRPPQSARAAARTLEARRLGMPVVGCCHAGCGNFEGESELALARTCCKLCSGCLVALYCSAACQRAAWAVHKAFCNASRARR